MAEWETIQERRISGKGVLKVPTDVVKNRAFVLFATVIREPRNRYANYNYNPPKSRYASLTFLRQGYVLDVLPMEYSTQVWDGVNDISGQTLIAVKCAYQGILQTFYNLSIALAATPGGQGLTPLTITDLIKDYESLRLAWDEIRVQCYADTGISLRLDRLKYDVCEPEKDRDKPPPPPPPPIPPVPPGEPFENDPAYDEDTQDDNNSQPFPGDEPQEVVIPPGTPISLIIKYRYLDGTFGGNVINYTREVVTPYYIEAKLNQYISVFVPNADGSAYTEFSVASRLVEESAPFLEIIEVIDSEEYPVDIRYL